MLLPQLTLPLLEGLTPSDHDVSIVTEDIEAVDFERRCDLVGITCTTVNAPRAYEIADEFRRRGVQVVLGGVHPTVLPQEAGRHADAVVVGEAEDVWADLLADAERKRLQPVYSRPHPSLERYVPVKHRKRGRRVFDIVPVMTTRGCPYDCEFCSVHSVFGRRLRHYPVDHVLRAIADSGSRWVFFVDDNVVGDTTYARTLFRELRSLKVRWIAQASISVASDLELLRLLADSGCLALFFGIESVSQSEIPRFPKLRAGKQKLEDSIKRVRESGIAFHPSFVFGFDSDTRGIFADTLEFLDRNRVGTADLCVLTPYPGTRIYERLKSEGRLITEDWRRYDRVGVVFRPQRMTPHELQTGALWTKFQFTRTSRIIRRLPSHLSGMVPYIAAAFSYRRNCRNQLDSGTYGVTRDAVRGKL